MTQELWYYESKDFSGKWIPKTSTTMPTLISPSGEKRNYQAIERVPTFLVGSGLDNIADHLSPEGVFYDIMKGKN